MRRFLLLTSIICLLGAVGCNSGRLVDSALDRVDESVKSARKEAKDTLKEARGDFEAALEKAKKDATDLRVGVAADIKEIQQDFDRKIDTLDRRFQERIEQIRSGAADLVKQSDVALQARIDQMFTELRLFVKETLLQIQDLVRPVLNMSDKAAAAFELAAKAITTISGASDRVANRLEGVFIEAQATMLAFRTGKNPDGTPTPISGILGIIAGIGAGLKGIADNKKRKEDNATEGYRWHDEEIDAKIDAKFAKLILEGKLILNAPAPLPPPPPMAPPGGTNAPTPSPTS